MKKSLLLILTGLIIISATAYTQSKMRIGVFDSRIIAVNYYQSGEFTKEIESMMKDFQEAKKTGDSTKVKKLEEMGQLKQRIAHDKGFGRGSVAEILEKYSGKIKELAQKEKLNTIISKWELIYSESNCEVIDITLKLLEALNAPEKIKTMYNEFKDVKPTENAFFIED